MTSGKLLAELARQVRRDTIRLVEAAAPEWLTYAPVGTSNHILWHAGHALWLQEVLCLQLLNADHQSDLPPDWADTYGMNCRPVSQSSTWPTQAEMIQMLNRQNEQLQSVLPKAADETLSRVADPDRGPLSIADRIIHGFHDEAKHTGEMYLLLKLCQA